MQSTTDTSPRSAVALTSTIETSPRPKSAYPFEAELLNNIKEYEIFKAIKPLFEKLNIDFNKLTVSPRLPYGEGDWFVLATKFYKLKSDKIFAECIDADYGKVFQKGCQEYAQDKRILKIALRGILNDHLITLITLESASPKNENLVRKIEERMVSLTPSVESPPIDFPGILRLLLNDDSSPTGTPSTSSPRSQNSSPRNNPTGSSSPTSMKRQLSRVAIAKRIKDSTSQIIQPEGLFNQFGEKGDSTVVAVREKVEQPIVEKSKIERSRSSPVMSHKKKSKEKVAGPELTMDVINEMLDEHSCTIILDDRTYKVSQGQLTEGIVRIILNAFDKAIDLHQGNVEECNHLRESLTALYAYSSVIDLFKQHKTLYQYFLKLVIGTEFCKWGLDPKKSEALINQYHGVLLKYNIPKPFEVICDKQKNDLWKLVAIMDMPLTRSGIVMLSDPLTGYQQMIIELSQEVKKLIVDLKKHRNHQITELRQSFREASETYKDDAEFLLFIGRDVDCKLKLERFTDNSTLALAQVSQTVLSIGRTKDTIEEMQQFNDLPHYLYLRDLFHNRISQLQQFYYMLAKSINNVVEYLETKEGMKKFFDSMYGMNPGETMRKRLRELLKNPLSNFETILSCLDQ